MKQSLSQADIQRLLEDPSADNRTTTARNIALAYGGGSLTDKERAMAEDIFQIMVRDAEVRVREALSINLSDCAFLAHDIARSLAVDMDAVALPILESSIVLNDEDLVEIVRNHGAAKQKAVAKRESVSELVSYALVDSGDEDVVATLVANEGAKISEPSLQQALDKHGDVAAVSESMAKRGQIPVRVAERLVSLVSESIQNHILAHHELPPEVVSDLVMQSRERATLGLLTRRSDGRDVRELVAQLCQNARLTPTIILRALCLGDMRFFEASIAVLAKVPLTKARILIHDKGAEGLGAVLQQANLPKPLMPAFQAAVEVSKETDYDGRENDRERFQRRIIERVLTHFEDPGARFGDENIDYLLAKLSQIDPSLTGRL